MSVGNLEIETFYFQSHHLHVNFHFCHPFSHPDVLLLFLYNTYKISFFLIILAAQTYCLFGIISFQDYSNFSSSHLFHIICYTAAGIFCHSLLLPWWLSYSVFIAQFLSARMFHRDKTGSRILCLFSIQVHNVLCIVFPLQIRDCSLLEQLHASFRQIFFRQHFTPKIPDEPCLFVCFEGQALSTGLGNH